MVPRIFVIVSDSSVAAAKCVKFQNVKIEDCTDGTIGLGSNSFKKMSLKENVEAQIASGNEKTCSKHSPSNRETIIAIVIKYIKTFQIKTLDFLLG